MTFFSYKNTLLIIEKRNSIDFWFLLENELKKIKKNLERGRRPSNKKLFPFITYMKCSCNAVEIQQSIM